MVWLSYFFYKKLAKEFVKSKIIYTMPLLFYTMITLQNYSVSIQEKAILHAIDISFSSSQTTVILWHNGSGKSSLALSIMGHPRYETSGNILLDEQDISTLSPDDRQWKGLFLSFQNVPEIPWIKVVEYLRTIYNIHFLRHNVDKKAPTPFVFRRMVEKMLPELHIDSGLLDRDLFVGFSGGEKRKIELLQILLLDPKVIILDEIDSWLDIDALWVLIQQVHKWQKQQKTILVISHNLHFLDHIDLDRVVIMKDGTVSQEGSKDLLETIKIQWFTA